MLLYRLVRNKATPVPPTNLGPQHQTARFASIEPLFRNLSRRSRLCCRCSPLLASVDSLGSLPASQDSPPGYRFPRSPHHCRWQLFDQGVRRSEATQQKIRTTAWVVLIFVEHRRFELLTPTLPVLCATNCANAPNSGYITICFRLCKALFSLTLFSVQSALVS